MAVSVVITQSDGNNPRSAMMLVNMDGNTSFNTGTDLGCTVASADEAGNAVDTSAAIAYASTGATTPDALVKNTVAEFNSELTGVLCWYSKNSDNEYVIHFEPIARVAHSVDISTPVFTPGA